MGKKANAIILAGTHADKTKLIYGKNKAFLEINNKPLVINVLDALKNAELIDDIGIVGPKKQLEKIIDNILIIEESHAPKESRRFIENALRTYNILSPQGERTFFITSDLPLVSSETIDDFVSKCNNFDAALYFSLINSDNIPDEINSFKKSTRLYLKGSGYFRTANMTLYEGSKIKDKEFIESQIERAFPQRRTASKLSKFRLYWFMAKTYPMEVVKYLACSLTKEGIEAAFRKKPGEKLKLIETEDSRASIEIDYEEEYEFIKKNYGKLKERFL